MNLIEILGILGIHWFADFVMQTDKQAKGKSKNWSDLLDHTSGYLFVWLVVGTVVWLFDKANILQVVCFSSITFIAHTITDYFTSRLNSKLWADGKIHNFFVSLGFDQYLHYIQLFLTYWYLFKSH